jgi:hypothetical protein
MFRKAQEPIEENIMEEDGRDYRDSNGRYSRGGAQGGRGQPQGLEDAGRRGTKRHDVDLDLFEKNLSKGGLRSPRRGTIERPGRGGPPELDDGNEPRGRASFRSNQEDPTYEDFQSNQTDAPRYTRNSNYRARINPEELLKNSIHEQDFATGNSPGGRPSPDQLEMSQYATHNTSNTRAQFDDDRPIKPLGATGYGQFTEADAYPPGYDPNNVAEEADEQPVRKLNKPKANLSNRKKPVNRKTNEIQKDNRRSSQDLGDAEFDQQNNYYQDTNYMAGTSTNFPDEMAIKAPGKTFEEMLEEELSRQGQSAMPQTEQMDNPNDSNPTQKPKRQFLKKNTRKHCSNARPKIDGGTKKVLAVATNNAEDEKLVTFGEGLKEGVFGDGEPPKIIPKKAQKVAPSPEPPATGKEPRKFLSKGTGSGGGLKLKTGKGLTKDSSQKGDLTANAPEPKKSMTRKADNSNTKPKKNDQKNLAKHSSEDANPDGEG